MCLSTSSEVTTLKRLSRHGSRVSLEGRGHHPGADPADGAARLPEQAAPDLPAQSHQAPLRAGRVRQWLGAVLGRPALSKRTRIEVFTVPTVVRGNCEPNDRRALARCVASACMVVAGSLPYNHMVVYQREVGPAQELNDRLFHALSDATRRDIVRRTMDRPQSVSTLASSYPMSFAAVQKHVAVLERAELISKRRRGREQLVSGNPETIDLAHRLLDELEVLWRDRIERIGVVLADGEAERQER